MTTAFDLGTAVHTLVLEPHLSSTVWCGPETRRGSAWKDQYAAAAEEGAILLTEGDYQIAVDMANSSLAADLLAKFLIECDGDPPSSEAEQTQSAVS